MASPQLSKKLDALKRPLDSLKADVEWYKLKQSERRRGDMPVLLQDDDLALRLRLARSDFLIRATELHNQLNQKATEKKGLAAADQDVRSHVLGVEAEFHALPLPKDL